MMYFSEKEFSCKCGCGLNNSTEELRERLDNARASAGISFVLSSACRCMSHNKTIGGSETSSHMLGVAVDIKCSNSTDRMTIVEALLTSGFNRIGIADRFIHADVDEEKPQNLMWTY